MIRRGTTKHCCWGLCKSDSRYPEKLSQDTTFVRFAKPGIIKDGMTDWEKNQAMLKTDKARRWLLACGRKDFNHVNQITKDTYICSLHFINGIIPTFENPWIDPLSANLSQTELSEPVHKKRKSHRKILDVKVDISNESSNIHSAADMIAADALLDLGVFRT